MDMLLINIGGTKKKVYQDLSKTFSAVDPPFWAALTAGFIRKHGFSVNIIDANAENLSFIETVARIRGQSPNLVAIVCYSQQANVSTPIMDAVTQLCHLIKIELPDQKLILTGWHPSALPQKSLAEIDCDLVVQGEGFYTLLGLLENRPYGQVPGLWWKESGAVRNTPRVKNIENLADELPDVAWDLLPMDKYRAFSWMCLGDFSERGKFASIFTSLGCPYKCSFCAIHATYGEHRVRYWSTEWVLKQIDILVQKYKVKHINVHDELFVFNPNHYMPIAKGLLEREYNLNLNVFARVDVLCKISSENLTVLKKAGFNWFKLGIETGNSRIRANVGKDDYSIDTVKSAVEKAHHAGINLCANFMFGLPGDNFESMQDTLDLALDLLPVFPSFFCTMAIPGSELYEQALANGVNLPDSWLGYASQGYEFLPLPTEQLTAKQVLEFRDYAFDTYFKNPRYLHMIETKFGFQSREHIEEMAKIKLKRKLLGD